MGEINHFSHEHPLMKEKLVTFIDAPESPKSCYGCRRDIEGKMYSCRECNFFLHKRCSKLPLNFNHPCHPEHPLILHASPMYPCNCIDCDKTCEGFTYHCLSCEFGLCVKSAFRALKNRKVKLDCHQHPLTLMQRPALIDCDACNDDDIQTSYACDICPFWIHKDCSNIMNYEKYPIHKHRLFLAYPAPASVLRYRLKCDFCRQSSGLSKWLYYCDSCLYFIHVKCFQNATLHLPAKYFLGYRKWRMHMTLRNRSGGLKCSLPLKKMHLSFSMFEMKGKKSAEIKHFSHDHPLSLSRKTIRNNSGEETLCDACIEPISDQYYTCVEDCCSYMLHSACAYLPINVEHPKHPGHQLTLKSLKKELGYLYCSYCHKTGNGFFFECDLCSFKLDLHCAIFSPSIYHEAHNPFHHLEHKKTIDESCEACGGKINGLGYQCPDCDSFYLHYGCAILPFEVKHQWDKHNLQLQFRPHRHDEDEFYCEVCEETINRTHWHYYCRKCDQSFHPFCIPRLGKDRFMKFGRTIRVDIHEHQLTSVRECMFDFNCLSCDVKLYGNKSFECETCSVFLCYPCVYKQLPPEPSLTDIVLVDPKKQAKKIQILNLGAESNAEDETSDEAKSNSEDVTSDEANSEDETSDEANSNSEDETSDEAKSNSEKETSDEAKSNSEDETSDESKVQFRR